MVERFPEETIQGFTIDEWKDLPRLTDCSATNFSSSPHTNCL